MANNTMLVWCLASLLHNSAQRRKVENKCKIESFKYTWECVSSPLSWSEAQFEQSSLRRDSIFMMDHPPRDIAEFNIDDRKNGAIFLADSAKCRGGCRHAAPITDPIENHFVRTNGVFTTTRTGYWVASKAIFAL